MPTRTVPARGGALSASGPKQSRRGSRNAIVEEETRSAPEVEAPSSRYSAFRTHYSRRLSSFELASRQRAAFESKEERGSLTAFLNEAVLRMSKTRLISFARRRRPEKRPRRRLLETDEAARRGFLLGGAAAAEARLHRPKRARHPACRPPRIVAGLRDFLPPLSPRLARARGFFSCGSLSNP
jgi:hypothetical protein